MKILFLTDNFPPESNAPATRTYEHCSKWVSLGYDVTVITCFPNFPTGKVYNGYKNKLYAKEETNGIKVIRVWSFITSNQGFVRRILDFSSFACSSFIYGLFVKTDIIVATSPQFFTAISARYLSIFKNKPWVMEIRDLWPNSIAAVGSMSKNSLAFKALKVIETRLYISAKKLVVVTDSFKNYLISDHNIDPKKIGVFKNGINLDTVKNYFSNNTIKLKHDLDLDNKIIISYIGTHGLAHALTFVLKATQRVENPNIHFLFIGDGAQKNKLVEYSKSLKKKNFIFLDSVPKNQILDYVYISDYSLVNLKNSEEFLNVIPSKIFENIALYKPILLGVEGESKKLIESNDVGISFEPENTESFLDAIDQIQNINFKSFKKNCDKMIVNFNRNDIAKNMIDFILKK
ncbi:glycosyltransferase family 4 protein [Flavobacteriales bacterium]|jgi:glycosyltransferase involved in cell wall biosynthesis|nr:glycosyltransferase family 4 protein [Flavobacteriales bacterium]